MSDLAVYAAVSVDKQQKLEQVKARMRELITMGNRIMEELTHQYRLIEDEKLYEGALNADGEPYRTMTDYAPDLIRELTPHLSERQFREYLRIDKAVVQNGLATWDEVVELGVTNFSKVCEALDYNQRTGAIAQEPREGKIGIDTARDFIEKMKETPEAWDGQHVEQALAEVRGVQLRKLQLSFTLKQGKFYLLDLVIWENDKPTAVCTEGVSQDMADWLARRIGASSNVKPPDAG